MACAAGAQAIAIQNESAFLDSFGGALIGAGAAGNADISVDDVLAFALGNSLNGAVIGASTALDASIGNIVSHDFPSIICFRAFVYRIRNAPLF